MIYKKSQEANSYQLVKFRSAHNHPLDDVAEHSNGVVDYSLIKLDYDGPMKKEEFDDYSLDGLPSNETTNSKGKISANCKDMMSHGDLAKSMNRLIDPGNTSTPDGRAA